MATRDGNPDDVLVAKEDFVADIDGTPQTAVAGKTRVRRGHPLHLAKPDSWEPIDVSPTIESATRAPGEKRGAPRGGTPPE